MIYENDSFKADACKKMSVPRLGPGRPGLGESSKEPRLEIQTSAEALLRLARAA